MNNELYHHGIIGQKWGVRRYQNPDGTLTEAGKARNRKSEKSDYQKAREKTNVKKMSDQELRSSINRLQMEQQYSSLKKSDSAINKGINFVKATAATTTAVITLYNNSGKLIEIGKKFLKK